MIAAPRTCIVLVAIASDGLRSRVVSSRAGGGYPVAETVSTAEALQVAESVGPLIAVLEPSDGRLADLTEQLAARIEPVPVILVGAGGSERGQPAIVVAHFSDPLGEERFLAALSRCCEEVEMN